MSGEGGPLSLDCENQPHGAPPPPHKEAFAALKADRDLHAERARQLEGEVQRLQRRGRERSLAMASYGLRIAKHLAGRDLVGAGRALATKVEETKTLPADEAGAFVGALAQRLTRVGLLMILGLVLAAIPSVLLYQQNELIAAQTAVMSRQNDFLRQQTESLREQIGQEREATLAAQRSQLLSTLFDEEACRSAEGDAPPCPMRAALRGRQEALLGFVSLERALGHQPQVRGLRLDGGADLARQDLHGVDLSGAKLSAANLYGADLRGALLQRVELSDADLRRTDLRGADLREVHLTQDQVYDVLYDVHTIWPVAFNPPPGRDGYDYNPAWETDAFSF